MNMRKLRRKDEALGDSVEEHMAPKKGTLGVI